MVVLEDNLGNYYGTFKTQEEAYAEIKKQIELRNFQSHYYRQSILGDGRIWLDYGSYTHFFYLTV